MATAPRPGTTPLANANKRRALSVTYQGQTYLLDFADLGPRDDIAIRRETGMPVSSYIMQDRFSSDSIAVIIWVARRKSGIQESFDSFLDGFPNMAEMARQIERGDLAVSSIEDGDDITDAEVVQDPLELGAP